MLLVQHHERNGRTILSGTTRRRRDYFLSHHHQTTTISSRKHYLATKCPHSPSGRVVSRASSCGGSDCSFWERHGEGPSSSFSDSDILRRHKFLITIKIFAPIVVDESVPFFLSSIEQHQPDLLIVKPWKFSKPHVEFHMSFGMTRASNREVLLMAWSDNFWWQCRCASWHIDKVGVFQSYHRKFQSRRAVRSHIPFSPSIVQFLLLGMLCNILWEGNCKGQKQKMRLKYLVKQSNYVKSVLSLSLLIFCTSMVTKKSSIENCFWLVYSSHWAYYRSY